jgi:hypothetical protein
MSAGSFHLHLQEAGIDVRILTRLEKCILLQYTDIPKVFSTHHIGNCCTNVIWGHCRATLFEQCPWAIIAWVWYGIIIALLHICDCCAIIISLCNNYCTTVYSNNELNSHILLCNNVFRPLLYQYGLMSLCTVCSNNYSCFYCFAALCFNNGATVPILVWQWPWSCRLSVS